MGKPDYVLINSISRSGGTFLKSLFDGVNGILAFPIEFPTIKGQIVDFIKQEHFEKLITVKDWLDETYLSYHLNRFYETPYKRTFGRERKNGEPAICFDYPHFLERLGGTYSTLGTVGLAYKETWKIFFASIYVDGKLYHDNDTGSDLFINQYATDISRDFAQLNENAYAVCNLYLLYIIRDPLENIASLKHHWSRVSNDSSFVRMSFARWEMFLYTVLRNKVLYPDNCDVMVYRNNFPLLREQFARSRVDIVKNAAAMDLQPTVLGLPFSGQSYKEKADKDVKDLYDYSNIFSQEELCYLQANIRRIYDFVGIDNLDDIAKDITPEPRFQEIIEMDSSLFELLLGKFGEAVSFAASFNVNFRRNIREYVRSLGLRKGSWEAALFLRRLLKGEIKN